MRRSFRNTRAPDGLDNTEIPPAPFATPAGFVAAAFSGIASDALGRAGVNRTRRSAAAKPFRVTWIV